MISEKRYRETGEAGRAAPGLVDPPEPELRLDRGARLQLKRGARWIDVTPVRCFPWSETDKYISLRDAAQNELYLVRDARLLEGNARRALRHALDVVGFVLEVVGVDAIEADFEIRSWRVRTRRGPRSFQTELDAWPRPCPGGGYLIEDVAGDVFFIPPLSTLDAESRRHLWPYVE